MPSYRLRLDVAVGVTDETLCTFLNTKSDAYLLVHHEINDNPHYHAYVETKYTQGNFSNLIKKTFNVSGAQQSNKKCDDDRKHEQFSYLFNTKKGNVPRYVGCLSISPHAIKVAEAKAKEIAKEFETKVKSGKKTKFDIAEIIHNRGLTSLSDTQDAIVDVLHMNRMCSAPFVVRDILSTVVHMDGGRHREEMKQQALKFFSQDQT